MASFSITRINRNTVQYEEASLIFQYEVEALTNGGISLYSHSPKVISGSVMPTDRELDRVASWLKADYNVEIDNTPPPFPIA